MHEQVDCIENFCQCPWLLIRPFLFKHQIRYQGRFYPLQSFR
jgi:hypothetical protein